MPEDLRFQAFANSIHNDPTTIMVMIDDTIIAILPNTINEYETMNATMEATCKAVQRDALVSKKYEHNIKRNAPDMIPNGAAIPLLALFENDVADSMEKAEAMITKMIEIRTLIITRWFFHIRSAAPRAGTASRGIHQYTRYSRNTTPSVKINKARMR